MENLFVGAYQRIRIEDVVISEVTNKLYDYAHHEAEIEALMESISEIGQKEPIIVIKGSRQIHHYRWCIEAYGYESFKFKRNCCNYFTF